jgi:hypothetical protein
LLGGRGLKHAKKLAGPEIRFERLAGPPACGSLRRHASMKTARILHDRHRQASQGCIETEV